MCLWRPSLEEVESIFPLWIWAALWFTLANRTQQKDWCAGSEPNLWQPHWFARFCSHSLNPAAPWERAQSSTGVGETIRGRDCDGILNQSAPCWPAMWLQPGEWADWNLAEILWDLRAESSTTTQLTRRNAERWRFIIGCQWSFAVTICHGSLWSPSPIVTINKWYS